MQATWRLLGTAGFSPASVALEGTSFAIAPDGTEYVAYGGTVQRYFSADGLNKKWTVYGQKLFESICLEPSGCYPDFMSLAFDKTGAFGSIFGAFVAYSDKNANFKATVKVYDLRSGSFSSIVQPGFSVGTASYLSMAIGVVNSKGTIFVVYSDSANGGRATCSKYVEGSSTWTIVGGAGFSAGQVGYTPIALDSAGTPYVALAEADGKANVQKLVGGTWTVVGNAGFSAGEARSLSLALDSTGTPWVAYSDGGNGYRATVQKLVSEGGGWTVVGNAGFSAGPAGYTSLALDSTGTPFVAYSDSNAGSKATVQKLVSGTWTVVGNAGFSAGVAIWACLALDKNGIPRVAYSDDPYSYTANSGKATVQYYS